MNKYSRQPGDSILALLEPGEYVLNRNAVDEIGREKLDDLNYDDAPRFDMSQRGQFQAGGMLGEMMGMQAGGDTLSYGGATTETQSLDDIYKKMGMQPNSQQLSQFEEQYAYDPTREGVIFEDYGRAITGATQAGQQNLILLIKAHKNKKKVNFLENIFLNYQQMKEIDFILEKLNLIGEQLLNNLEQ